MPLDAICLRAVLAELTPKLVGARIDKVQQPARDQIVLSIRGCDRLLLSANPNQPRIQFTTLTRDNPAQPPMFCMLLRKHLVGARIVSVEQPDLERIVVLTLHATDELGQGGERKLVLECMGRRANLILLDGDGRILDCLRRVDFETTGDRQLLPGLFYRFPTPIDRLSLLRAPEDSLAAAVRGGEAEQRVDEWLLATYLGLSPLVTRELAYAAGGATDVRFTELSEVGRDALVRELTALSTLLREGGYVPTLLTRGGKPVEFTYRAIGQYGTETTVERRESFSALLDEFYDARERQELSARRGRELTRTASTARDRLVRKLDRLRSEYAATQDRDALRLRGELLTANLYRMERGMARITVENYYEDACPPLDIALDPLLTPQQNAARYYKQYTKAKTAELHLREQIEKAESERAYLESVLAEIVHSETEQEFAEIRHELQETGYLRHSAKEKKELKRSFAPREYRTSGGLRVLVGRNNGQNDLLTKKADKRDLWFHTQKIHGSHVILCTEGAKPEEHDVLEAALLAAWWSQAQGGVSVPVDYTAVKNVKKPVGARPGMVVYETYRTVYVTAEENAVKKLAVK